MPRHFFVQPGHPDAGNSFDHFLLHYPLAGQDVVDTEGDDNENDNTNHNSHGLDLDGYDLLDYRVANQLQHDGGSRHPVPYFVHKEKLRVVGIDIEQDDRDAERNT